MDAPVLFETEYTETRQNPLTGNYLVIPKPGCLSLPGNPYSCATLRFASRMAQTMDHYERTGEQKAFKPLPAHLQQGKRKHVR